MSGFILSTLPPPSLPPPSLLPHSSLPPPFLPSPPHLKPAPQSLLIKLCKTSHLAWGQEETKTTTALTGEEKKLWQGFLDNILFYTTQCCTKLTVLHSLLLNIWTQAFGEQSILTKWLLIWGVGVIDFYMTIMAVSQTINVYLSLEYLEYGPSLS